MKKLIIILLTCLLVIVGCYIIGIFYDNYKIDKYKSSEFILGGQDSLCILNNSKNEIERIYLLRPIKISIEKNNPNTYTVKGKIKNSDTLVIATSKKKYYIYDFENNAFVGKHGLYKGRFFGWLSKYKINGKELNFEMSLDEKQNSLIIIE